MLFLKGLSRQKAPFLFDISASLEPGKIYALLGKNGAGKSTLLSCIAALLPSEGDIIHCGQNLQSLSPKQRAEITHFVSPHLEPAFPLSVEEAIAMGGYARDLPPDPYSLEKVMEEMGILSLRKREILSLSQGEKQRVKIARALFSQAEILLFDESCAHLDLASSLKLVKSLQSEAFRSTIIILSTHDLSIAQQGASEVLLLKKGRLIGQASFEELEQRGKIEDCLDVSKKNGIWTSLSF